MQSVATCKMCIIILYSLNMCQNRHNNAIKGAGAYQLHLHICKFVHMTNLPLPSDLFIIAFIGPINAKRCI